MCFYISKKHPNKKIATKNITCYKILNGNFTSYYHGLPYKAHLLVTSKIGKPKKYWPSIYEQIEKGLHSYSSVSSCINKRWGVYFYAKDLIIVKCIIPAGSEYYYNEQREEYVSNQIIMVEEVK